MNDEKLYQLLKQADAAMEVGPPDAERLTSAVRQKLRHRRQLHRRVGLVTVIFLAAAGIFIERQYQARQKQIQIARMEQEIQQLTEQTEATLALVQEVLARQKQQDKLNKLNRQLARYTHDALYVESGVDKEAYTLFYRAEQMQKQPETKDAAIENYQRVIDYFPENKWAETARERLKELNQNNHINHINHI